MNRSNFIKRILVITVMASLNTLKGLTDGLKKEEKPMPFLFIGHGSPMNGIEENSFSRYWQKLGRELPVPKAVLCISAHCLLQVLL